MPDKTDCGKKLLKACAKQYVKIVWPQKGMIPARKIIIAAHDAVENNDTSYGYPTSLDDAIKIVNDAGYYTTSKG